MVNGVDGTACHGSDHTMVAVVAMISASQGAAGAASDLMGPLHPSLPQAYRGGILSISQMKELRLRTGTFTARSGRSNSGVTEPQAHRPDLCIKLSKGNRKAIISL